MFVNVPTVLKQLIPGRCRYTWALKGNSGSDSNYFLSFHQTLMLVGTTTRPLLGCTWNFPDPYRGLIYSTASLLIHEILPIILMCVTNVSTLCKLYGHGSRRLGGNAVEDSLGARRIPAERRAAKVRGAHNK